MLEKDKSCALQYFFELSKQINEFRLNPENLENNSLVHKEQPRNVLISDIVKLNVQDEKLGEKISLYYSIARPNFHCDFIFDHPLDHYSFMLIIEVARQMSIGITHKYKNFPINTIKNTVSNMDLKIHSFAELDYPLILGCIDKIEKSKPTMQIHSLYFYFVQNGKLCAELKSGISVMSGDLYNRYRINNRRNTVGYEDVNLITNLDMIDQQKIYYAEREQACYRSL
jgi:A-factor biosynthesis repeat.